MFTTAGAAVRGSGQSPATAACSVHTGQYRVRLCSPEIVATELIRNVRHWRQPEADTTECTAHVCFSKNRHGRFRGSDLLRRVCKTVQPRNSAMRRLPIDALPVTRDVYFFVGHSRAGCQNRLRHPTPTSHRSTARTVAQRAMFCSRRRLTKGAKFEFISAANAANVLKSP